jgi:hypothetical protein
LELNSKAIIERRSLGLGERRRLPVHKLIQKIGSLCAVVGVGISG